MRSSAVVSERKTRWRGRSPSRIFRLRNSALLKEIGKVIGFGIVGLCGFGIAPGLAQSPRAECASLPFERQYTTAYLRATPLSDAQVETANAQMPEFALAQCQQDRIVDALIPSMGPVVGYKVAATSPPVQQQLGLDSPLVGRLFSSTFHPNGATIALDSGANLVFEADLVVRVGSDRINSARTIAEVAEHLDAVFPFIEVPDLMFPQGAELTGPLLVASNVGTRWGILGDPIPMTPAVADRLATLQVTLQDGTGETFTQATGRDLLGHPLAAVLFLIAELEERDLQLQPGDLLSLGSFGRFHPAKASQTITATYTGLTPQPATVTVTFE